MSNLLHYDLEVLADSPAEIDQIGHRLEHPSAELVNRFVEKSGRPADNVADDLKGLVAFSEAGENHFDLKERSFAVSFKNNGAGGLVDSHLFDVSQAFPQAVFLLTYYHPQASYAGKQVIRSGEIIQSMHDDYHREQAVDWVLLDIFTPFKIEHYRGLECGSLWQEWLDDVGAAVQVLKCHTSRDRAEAERWSNELLSRHAEFHKAEMIKAYSEENPK